MKRICWLSVGVTCMLLGSAAFADVKLPAIFSDNMVLQKGEKTVFFGTADKGEKVSVKVGNASADGVAGDDGKWKLFVDTRNAQGPVDVTVSGNNSITIKNALIGEVWVASGQFRLRRKCPQLGDGCSCVQGYEAPWPPGLTCAIHSIRSATALKSGLGC